MNKNNNIISVGGWMSILVLAMTTTFIACTSETDDIIVPATLDALALLPAETPVGIQVGIESAYAETRADGEGTTATTTYYAKGEIHAATEVDFTLYVPGASSENNRFLSQKKEDGSSKTVPFKDLGNTEPFSQLMLKDFNLVEGDNRNVSRWTILNARYNNGQDNLCGWARLKAGDNGMPVLDYGEMKRVNAKMTVVLQDEEGKPLTVSGGDVTAVLSLPKTNTWVIYTPEGEMNGKDFDVYCYKITTLADDAAIDADRIGLAMYADAGADNEDITLEGMVNADGSSTYFGADNNMLSAIVASTATHAYHNDGTYTAITPTFTGTEKLTITVADNHPGLTGTQTGGKYSLALKDVKLADGTNLTALKSGGHYTLTVTLRHNTQVSATATIGNWSVVSADAELGGDPAKLPDNENDQTMKQ